MPVSKVRLRPGINTQLTRTQNEAGFSDGNLMRARDGLMECLGGWVKYAFGGISPKRTSELHAWADLSNRATLAMGSDRIIIYVGGVTYDVTAYVQTHVTTNSLSTVAGSNVIALTDTSAYNVAGGVIQFTTTAAVGGLAAGTYYAVLLTGNGTTGTFSIVSPVTPTPTGTATGGGTVTINYNLNPSLFGSTFWSFDNWGEDLVSCPQYGGIYTWLPSLGPGARSTPVGGDAPLAAAGILVGMPERHLIALGSSPAGGSAADPLLITWSDTENYSLWTATAYNAAGSYRIAAGSKIVAWKRAAGQILLWTDIGLVGMSYVGTPYIYAFNELATACGIIGPKAAVTIGNTAFWMSPLSFWSYDGQAVPIPCDVRDRVFGNLNVSAGALVCAAINGQFNEITWYYPSLGSSENDSYVTLNYVDRTWVCGMLSRTAWVDQSVVGPPVGAAPDGSVYQHEVGKTSNGAAIANSLTTGFFDIGDGEAFSFLDQVIMDFADQVGTVNVTLQAQAYPNGPITTKGPFAVLPSTPFISPRIRGRQIALKFDSVGIGTFWRLGALRTRIAADGRR